MRHNSKLARTKYPQKNRLTFFVQSWSTILNTINDIKGMSVDNHFVQ